MNVTAVKTRVLSEREDLVCFIEEHIPHIREGTVLVIASKIVSLAEGRTRAVKNRKEKLEIIVEESEKVVSTKHVELALTKGFLLPNAGVDESNGNGNLVLLPKDSFKAAELIRMELMRIYKVRHLGVIISDSLPMPLRKGVVGIALGYAGFRGVKSYKGKKDLYGRRFKFASVNIADSLATAAVLVMGEGSEKRPLALIEGTSVEFSSSISKKAMLIDPKEDMYAPLLRFLSRK